jgi:hypothetical protein
MAHTATVSLTSTNYISLSGVSPFELTIDPRHINVPNKIRRIDYDFGDDVTYSQSFYGPDTVGSVEDNDPRYFPKTNFYNLVNEYRKTISVKTKVYQFGQVSPTIFTISLNLTVPTLEGLDGGYFENLHLISTRMFGPNNDMIYTFESENPYYILPVLVNWKSRPIEPIIPVINNPYRPYKLLAPFEDERSTSIGTSGQIKTVTDTPAPPGVTDTGIY